MTETTRRAMVVGAGGAGLAAALAACGGYSATVAQPVPEAKPAEELVGGIDGAGSGAGSGGGSGSGSGGGARAGSGAFAKTESIPEGGGRIYKSQKVVVTQPAAGQFKAFSVTCPHQGCAVDSVSNGEIICPCHGSKFNIQDGSVANGPAGAPLEEMPITVDGEKIRLA